MATAHNSTPVKITMHNVIPYMETLHNYVDGMIIDQFLFLYIPCNFTLLKDRKLAKYSKYVATGNTLNLRRGIVGSAWALHDD